MVDHTNAFNIEDKLFDMLNKDSKCKKYKLVLHKDDPYGIDIVATAKGYEGFAIEIESTQHVSKWPVTEPYPPNWNWFSVPKRKHKFFIEHPMSLFVKVNADMSRAAIAPMSYICSSEFDEYDNENAHHMKRNDFYTIRDAHHPAICYCPIKDVPEVIDAQFKAMVQMKRINVKFTDKRPTFSQKRKKES